MTAGPPITAEPAKVPYFSRFQIENPMLGYSPKRRQKMTGARGKMRADTVTTLMRRVRFGLVAILLLAFPAMSLAAPFAAYVMDARTGETLYSQNADTRLYPASLTKMMTLYIVFDAIEHGKLSLDTMVTVSANAAGQAPSRLGLRTGQQIQLRYLIRGAAIKSANDAAAAMGDFIGGNEAGFAAKMNAMAQRLGMKNTTFKNANGLTREGHLSTAHDMAILGRHLIYDFPQYYGLFSRRTADAGIAKVASTNRKFLDAYDGADGIKTGYTVAAGFNLVASAQRGNKRVIGAIFGATSPAERNTKMAALLDMGFQRSPGSVKGASATPQLVALRPSGDVAGPEVNGAEDADEEDGAAVAPSNSQRPMARPEDGQPAAPDAAYVAATETRPSVRPVPSPVPVSATAAPQPAEQPAMQTAGPASVRPLIRPVPAPRDGRTTAAATPQSAALPEHAFVQSAAPQPETVAMAAEPVFPPDTIEQGDADPRAPVLVQGAAPKPESQRKSPRNDTVILASLSPPAPSREKTREMVSRSEGQRSWGISIGSFASKYAAERAMLQVALTESDTLSSATRNVQARKSAFEATFVNMTRSDAELACARLAARASTCSLIGH